MGLALAALFEVWWCFSNDFQMAWMYEFSAYADIARSIAEGGYHSQFVYPTELATLETSSYAQPPWPVTYRFPLFAAWVGIFFKLFGPSDGAVVVAGASAWALFVVSTYHLGASVFPGQSRLALRAALLMLATPVMFRYFTLWGYADILFGVVLLWHHSLLIQRKSREMFWVGLLGGLCFLGRFNFVIFVPVAALYLFLRKKELPSLGYFLGFLLPVLGYRMTRPDVAAELQQTTILAGNLGQIDQTIPWLEYARTPALGELVQSRFGSLIEKGVFNLSLEMEWMTRPFGHYLFVPFALVGLYLGLARGSFAEKSRDWVCVYLGCGFLQLASFSFLRVESLGRYWAWILPCFVLLAMFGLDRALNGLSPRWASLGLKSILALTLFWLITQLRYTVTATENLIPAWTVAPPPLVEFRQIAEAVPSGGLVISNVAVHVAWYSNRPAVDLPNSVEQLQSMLAKHPAKAVFIVNWPQGELYNRAQWQALVATPNWEKSLAEKLGAKEYTVARGGVLFLLK